MSHQNVDDELAIRNLVARYADSVSRRDPEAWVRTWSAESTWDMGGVVSHGPAEALARWQSALAGYPWLVQITPTGEVFFDESGAHGIWYVVEFQQSTDAGLRLVLGRYEDTYVCDAEGWRFRTRRFQAVYRGPLGPGTVSAIDASPAVAS